LGIAVASTEEMASVGVDSGTAAASAEEVASVEVDSAALAAALATAKRSFVPPICENRPE
jgi:predicted RNA methylase